MEMLLWWPFAWKNVIDLFKPGSWAVSSAIVMEGLNRRPAVGWGEPLCIFYSRYEMCKFGPSCKFDHPMGVFTYNLSTPSSADVPVVRRLSGLSSGTGMVTLSSEGLNEGSAAKPRRLSLSEARQLPSGDKDIDTEG
ncbi:unnamed protein product [Ilex paraguariensis]|uniref:C3H1-type domain-containing protein n=1 Tax=Ilex paraguariensis TaxID=185542 RepID=A0ABC8TLG7_9AQUA